MSNLSEQGVLRQKLSETQALLSEDQDRSAQALVELSAIAAQPMAGPTGLADLSQPPAGVVPLAVLLAEVEKDRAIAEASMERAAHLPSLKAGGSLGGGGTGVGLSIDSERMWRFGTGATLAATEAATDAAGRRVADARQQAVRRIRSLEQLFAGLERQDAGQAEVARQIRRNLDLFEAQNSAGTRPLMELVNLFEPLATMERDLVDLRHDRVRIRVEIAREAAATDRRDGGKRRLDDAARGGAARHRIAARATGAAICWAVDIAVGPAAAIVRG